MNPMLSAMSKYLPQVPPFLRRWIRRPLGVGIARPYYYLGKQQALIELHDGSPFVVDTESLDISTDLMRRGRWEDWIEPHIINSVGPGSVFVDAGANMGYYSVVVGRVVGPMGRVYAYEPNPSLYRLLKKNFFINGLHGSAFPCALGRERRAATLWVRTVDSGGGYFSNDLNCEGQAPMPFEVGSVDDILANDLQIDPMKIDVGGHEPEVVAENERTAGRLFPYGFKIAPWAGICEDGVFVAPTANDAPAVFGPYVLLTPGSYEATFDIALLSDTKQASIAFDVAADWGTDFLAQREVTIDGSHHVQSVKLGFKISAAGARIIELRVHPRGAGLVVKDIRCTRLDLGSNLGIPVTVRTLDDTLGKDTRIDAMKIDVEGHEPAVVAGAENALKRSHRLKVFVELNPQAWVGQGYDPNAFLEGLVSMGFDFHILLHEGVKLCEASELLELAGRLPYTTHFVAARP
jgi:FkbM family methyltransferase